MPEDSDRLFSTADTLIRVARTRRRHAIDGHANLHWVVVLTSGLRLEFDRAPSHEAVTEAARAAGHFQPIAIHSIMVEKKKPRRFVLLRGRHAR